MTATTFLYHTHGPRCCLSSCAVSSSSSSRAVVTGRGQVQRCSNYYSARMQPQHVVTERKQTMIQSPGINTALSHVLLPTRCLAIKTKAKNRTKNMTKPGSSASRSDSSNSTRPKQQNHHHQQQQQQPINEHLIRMLVGNGNSTADDIQIRLILDQGRDEKPAIEIMSLTDAIKISGEKGMDLVGIQVKNQDIPVIKCVDFQKYLYQQNKKGSKTKGSGGGSSGGGSGSGGGNKATKQFSFKAGIDNDDLERKAKNMVSYLVKGHSCQVTITSSRRNLQSDANVIMTTLERLKEFVGGDGNPQGKIKTNEWGNRGTLLFQPVSRKN